jgi:hypothetical protein
MVLTPTSFQYNYTIFCSFSQEFFPKTYSFVLHPAEFVFFRMVPGFLLSVFSFTRLTFVRYIFNNFSSYGLVSVLLFYIL